MPALYAGARTTGNAGTGEPPRSPSELGAARGNARTTPHERIRSRSRVPAIPCSRLFEAVQAGTSLPRTTGCAAPVAEGTLPGLPATASLARIANATASLARLAIPHSSVVRTCAGRRERAAHCRTTGLWLPPRPMITPSGGPRGGRNPRDRRARDPHAI